jgi:hypothetical protein
MTPRKKGCAGLAVEVFVAVCLSVYDPEFFSTRFILFVLSVCWLSVEC